MANLDFPQDPEIGQEYKSPKGKSYWWDGVKWSVKRPIIVTHSPEPEVVIVPDPTPVPVKVVHPLEATIGGIDFPPYPVIGYEFIASSGITYIWDGVKWVVNQNVVVDNGGGGTGGGTGTNYVLPIATNTRLGGVRIGTGIINQNGTISVDLASTQGDKGDTGPAGPTGNDGLNAYQIAVDGGFVGTIDEWLASIKGPKGDKGDPGNLTIATRTTTGGVIPGLGIDFDQTSGTISVPKGAGINTVADIPDVNPTGLTDGSLLIYNAGASRWNVTTNLTQENWDSGQY